MQAPVPAQAAAPVPAAPAANPAAPPTSAGGFDVDAIRRVWPEVLGRIFTMRRATWTFVSEHAQVIDYDGQRLVLGISTTGLTQTFRAGNHAELIRQALIDQIGLDARVEGVPMPAGGGIPSGSGGEGPSAAPRGSSPAPPPASSQAAAPPPTAAPAAAPTPTPVAQAAPQASTPAPAPAPTSAAAPTPAPEPDIPLPPEPPEAGFEPPPDPADHRPPTNHADHAHSVRAELARAKEATRRTMDERHHRSDPAPAPRATSPQSDLGAASLDDEVVQEGAEIGQAVIERMLGGTVLGDTPT